MFITAPTVDSANIPSDGITESSYIKVSVASLDELFSEKRTYRKGRSNAVRMLGVERPVDEGLVRTSRVRPEV